MDFPVDIWEVIKHFMTPREFTKICSTSRAFYAVRQQLTAAEVRYEPGDDEQVLLRQLQLDRWPTCHSLCIDLGQLDKAVDFCEAQSDSIGEAGNTMSSLHCLHLMGRKGAPLTEGGIEGMLVSLLARHAIVVTCRSRLFSCPRNGPN